jgi:hypothetical protein
MGREAVDLTMSQTYSLVCDAVNQKIWIGQGSYSAGAMTSFYSGDPETMGRLGRFLMATRGKLLCILADEYCEDYEEFEPPPDADD